MILSIQGLIYRALDSEIENPSLARKMISNIL